MEFKIQLSLPYGERFFLFDPLFNAGKKVASKVDLEGGGAGDALCKTASHLQMLLGRAAAAIPPAEGQEDLVIQLLLLNDHLSGKALIYVKAVYFNVIYPNSLRTVAHFMTAYLTKHIIYLIQMQER